ncbi:MAG: hypothetical protein E3J64_08575 [Anaerolineales bacterium]|nr:MAG: hypothetical protein E3J64_08575 [Anaerolineales bacterium]
MAERVKVVGKDGKGLGPCHPARARILRRRGRAVVWCRTPYTIQLVDRRNNDERA